VTTTSFPRVTLHDLVVANPEIMGGRPVFRNTRVPVEVLFENLADGLSLDEILDAYPTLDRADVISVLEQMPATIGAASAV
jgi:uncharacterized protein (DUF433 family)